VQKKDVFSVIFITLIIAVVIYPSSAGIEYNSDNNVIVEYYDIGWGIVYQLNAPNVFAKIDLSQANLGVNNSSEANFSELLFFII